MDFCSAKSLNFPGIYDVVKQTLTKLLKVKNPLFGGVTAEKLNEKAQGA